MAWTTARKEAARDNAERLGALQLRVTGSRWYALAVVLAFFLVAGLAIGGLEHSL